MTATISIVQRGNSSIGDVMTVGIYLSDAVAILSYQAELAVSGVASGARYIHQSASLRTCRSIRQAALSRWRAIHPMASSSALQAYASGRQRSRMPHATTLCAGGLQAPWRAGDSRRATSVKASLTDAIWRAAGPGRMHGSQISRCPAGLGSLTFAPALQSVKQRMVPAGSRGQSASPGARSLATPNAFIDVKNL